jgi:predicted heme/steroid binding protein
MGAKPARLTMDEVQKHASKDDAWLVLFGEAIDVTKFIPLHPGGEDNMLAYLGKDATEDWQQIHRPEHLEKYVQHLGKMGKIKKEGLLSWLWTRMNARQDTQGDRDAAFSSQQQPQEQDVTATEEPKEDREPVRWSLEHEAELPPGGNFDLSELSRWDGVQLPMCIGICGIVLDVSSSDNFVPDFGYGKLWAGRDTTWAMATASLKAHDANRFDFQLSDLSQEQFDTLASFYKHFTVKYRQVGTLRELRDWDFSTVESKAAELPAPALAGN